MQQDCLNWQSFQILAIRYSAGRTQIKCKYLSCDGRQKLGWWKFDLNGCSLIKCRFVPPKKKLAFDIEFNSIRIFRCGQTWHDKVMTHWWPCIGKWLSEIPFWIITNVPLEGLRGKWQVAEWLMIGVTCVLIGLQWCLRIVVNEQHYAAWLRGASDKRAQWFGSN